MKQFYQKTFGKILITSLMIFSVSVVFAQRKVSGKITDAANGDALPGASITVKGTSTGATADASGNYSISVPNSATLVVSFLGYAQKEITVGNQSTINISLDPDAQSLQEVVVTGYQQLRKRDITGAVTVVEAEGLKSIKSSSFTQNLAGRAAGVTISSSGSPGDATNVRVRGIGSFTSNDPLYVIDGVPVQDQYQNTINPDDIESIQVLKDASTASIYGSRASNGVIVITTKRGKAGKTKVSYNGAFGLVNPVKGYDKILNTSSSYYAEAMKRKFSTDASNTPWYAKDPNNLPQYIHTSDPTLWDPAKYDILNNQVSETNKSGTNWWDEMTRTAQMHDHSLNLSGGNESATFSISGSYLKQEGILNFTDFNRGTIRANSAFKISKKLRLGENMMYSANWGVGIGSVGGSNNEQGVLGNLLKATPIVPLYDIKGNPGGHLTAQTGNFTNPTQVLINNKDNTNKYNRFLGNFYAEYDVIDGLTLRTSFGTDFGNGWNRRFTYPEPYRVEGNKTQNSFNEGWNQTFTWTWTNTIAYNKKFGIHGLNLLAGQEAIANKNRNINGNLANFFTMNVNSFYLQTALADPGSRQVNSGGGESKLASYFAKADYSFDDKYLISATVRRDGSSRFLSDVRYGIFPAVSLGWRLSQEAFMKDLTWLTDLKVRASYGEVGNQNIRNYNFADIYGGSVGGTFYDINGANGGVATGYALTTRGNAATKWETAKTQNFGLDAAFLNNSLTLVLDVYKRNTDNLLYNPALPGTAGAAAPPFVNVGSMVNTGFDLALGYRKNVNKDLSFNTSLNLSHYKNEIKKIADNSDEFYPSDNLTERLPQSNGTFINKVGYPISSFRGFIVEGLITSEAEKAKQLAGSFIGGLKFKDVNGDGKINDDDLAIIGNPHPKLTGGWNIGANYKNFDITAFFFGSYGNKIFNATKIQTYFMNFNSNVMKGILEKEGTGNNPKINGLDAASRSASTFYVEDGSYTRLANLQIGYRIPKTIADKLKFSSARIYLQGQNLFTITKYSGADPAVSNANIGNAGNVNDLRTGYDNGNYPSNKIMSVGVNLEF